MRTKVCPKCKVEKSWADFHKRIVKGEKVPTAWCRLCTNADNRERRARDPERYNAKRRGKVDNTRASWLRRLRLLGLSEADYLSMLAAQDGKCAICGRGDPGKIGTWPVDHDHESGVVRGLLCHRCNQALGLFGDDPEVLSAAAAYLARQRVSPCT